MKIVVDIPDFIYTEIRNITENTGIIGHNAKALYNAIYHGTPLPKGHGKLIDVSDIEWAKHREERNYIDYEVIDWDDIVNSPTIIEADKEVDE